MTSPILNEFYRPPPENPFFVEENEVADDAFPDPPAIPAGWVHVRSECIPPRAGGYGYSEDGGGGGGGAPRVGTFGPARRKSAAAAPSSSLSSVVRSTGEAARKAAEKAGPGLGAALDKTRSGAAWAAGSVRQLNEDHRIVDRTWSAASSAARSVKDLRRKESTRRSAKHVKNGWNATLELARRSSGRSPPRS